MGTPTVTSLSFYRSGVASVTRMASDTRGFTLDVRREHVEDVLATLRTTGPVRGVVLDPVEDLLPAPNSDAWVRFVTGTLLHTYVTVTQSGSNDAGVGGAVLGVEGDRSLGDGELVTNHLVLYNTGSCQLHRIPVNTITSLKAYDRREGIASSLKDNHRRFTVQVDSAKGPAYVGVEYLVPSPVYTVKYDLSVDGTVARVTPWAILTNPLDEEVTGATVTLTTGRPVSFQIDMTPADAARSRVTQDLQVEGPVSHQATRSTTMSRSRNLTKGAPVAVAATAGLESMRSMEPMLSSMGVREISDSDEIGSFNRERSLEGSTEGLAAEGESGEEVVYVLPNVTLGAKATVTLPLVTFELPASVRRVYRKEGGDHPHLSVVLSNGADRTLERGPATLRVAGDFVGQAVLNYTPRNADLTLSYSVDRTISVSVGGVVTENKVQAVRGARSAGALELLVHRVNSNVVKVSSLRGDTVPVVFEFPTPPSMQMEVEGVEHKVLPKAGNLYRVSVDVPPGGVEFTLRASAHLRSNFHFRDLTPEIVVGWRTQGVLREGQEAAITEVMAAAEKVATLQGHVTTAEKQVATLENRETNLITKLNTLGNAAGSVSARYVTDLDAAVSESASARENLQIARKALSEAQTAFVTLYSRFD